eukprot:12419704-Karenia_brevis.AAC.1
MLPPSQQERQATMSKTAEYNFFTVILHYFANNLGMSAPPFVTKTRILTDLSVTCVDIFPTLLGHGRTTGGGHILLLLWPTYMLKALYALHV